MNQQSNKEKNHFIATNELLRLFEILIEEIRYTEENFNEVWMYNSQSIILKIIEEQTSKDSYIYNEKKLPKLRKFLWYLILELETLEEEGILNVSDKEVIKFLWKRVDQLIPQGGNQ